MLPINHSERPLIEPQEVVKELASRRGLKPEELKVPEYMLLSLSAGVTPLLIKELRAKRIPWIYKARSLFIGRISREVVGIIWAAPGAPLTAMIAEDLIVCGAKVLIGIGLFAAIQPEIRVGDLIIPTLAVRGEGLSHYYLPKEIEAVPDRKLVEVIKASCEDLDVKYSMGPIYTTDAPYRETKSMIERLQKERILGIDMETSALFSIGVYRKVKTACILVASTNLSRIRSIGFYAEELNEPVLKAIAVCKKSVRKILKRKMKNKFPKR